MTDTRVFELRTYEAVPGKIDALVARIGDHAATLFEKHGMENIGFWVQTDDEGKRTDTLTYIVAHDSRDAAAQSWKAFWEDPEWQAIRANGEQVTAGATSVFIEATDYSKIR
ncbi:NIPSNAP family protein [Mycolicibacterium brumae]|uniref:NIPSNAP family protein n=1 Tax=Mycolicibacterium brumae TaxID=85968 RepID=A0A2G5P480_9MYCO|nr:NIPSNAP family protein [Mycolicibacterium brumae]MCV7191290.1 NIPSNAP family protein [Mycolicibacterium brumae]PIB73208.1 NIPSNAP family protein [Mycolicibacterium brumae]RWA17806.1 hypothetical protein MBRU_18400 [Mycolicibacterium brumae DSM 44177]UWW09743.1 NIPSNAP family protein [Mycolicibacterium brumae]